MLQDEYLDFYKEISLYICKICLKNIEYEKLESHIGSEHNEKYGKLLADRKDREYQDYLESEGIS